VRWVHASSRTLELRAFSAAVALAGGIWMWHSDDGWLRITGWLASCVVLFGEDWLESSPRRPDGRGRAITSRAEEGLWVFAVLFFLFHERAVAALVIGMLFAVASWVWDRFVLGESGWAPRELRDTWRHRREHQR
jgi:hypothetical protein